MLAVLLILVAAPPQAPVPPQAPAARVVVPRPACDCSSACTCGCNEGKSCDCDRGGRRVAVPSRAVSAVVVPWVGGISLYRAESSTCVGGT